MKHVPLSSIDFDSATQVRAEINHDVVVDYAERMEAGDKFPLIGTGADNATDALDRRVEFQPTPTCA